VRYALDDVRYLVALRQALLAQCDSFGTRAWLEEDLLKFESPEAYGEMEPDEAWKRVKNASRYLRPYGLAGLRAVASVRETRAREWNLPRAWLGEDGSLIALAERLQRGETSFPNVRFRHRLKNNAQRDRLAADYAAALVEASRLPEEDWPLPVQPDYPSEVRDAADKAHDYLVARGEELHVDPALFANRAQLLAFVDDPEVPDNPLAEGWRFETVGRTIIERFYVP
jgi:ribonuclease D